MTDALPPRGHVPATPYAIMRARIRMTTGERMSVLRISTAIVAIAIGATFALSACAPIIVAGAAAGAALVATDRRSAGAQVDDQAIETKAGARAGLGLDCLVVDLCACGASVGGDQRCAGGRAGDDDRRASRQGEHRADDDCEGCGADA